MLLPRCVVGLVCEGRYIRYVHPGGVGVRWLLFSACASITTGHNTHTHTHTHTHITTRHWHLGTRARTPTHTHQAQHKKEIADRKAAVHEHQRFIKEQMARESIHIGKNVQDKSQYSDLTN